MEQLRGKTFSYIFEAGKTFEGKRKVIEKSMWRNFYIIISSNPANYIKVPKKAPTNIIKCCITAPEKFNFYTEMRIGEVCGLSWDNYATVLIENGATQRVWQVV